MTDQQSFVHLHVHSEFSLLDGLSRINDLVERAVELNQPAVALTDHGAMYGTMPFYRAAKSAGIKPIIGIETYLSMRGMGDRDPQLDKNRYHMLLLAQNQTGYLNLLQIASAAQLDGYYYKPRIDRSFMAGHSDGVIATTGCMAAEIPRALGAGNQKLADKLLGEYLDIFGKERLFIELQEHHIPELTVINKMLIQMAPRFGLESNFLATNDVHYTRAEDANPHETLLCIQTGSTIQNPKLTFSDKEYYLKSYAEMAHLFGEIPGALSNSLLIAEMCDVHLDSDSYHLPEFEVPAGYDAHTYMRHLCEKGLIWRYGEERAQYDEALRTRLDHEMGIINRMGFDTYFLIVWDLCEWAARSDEWYEMHQDPFPYESYQEWKDNDIWWNVRGSGAGSVVAYTLGITSIEPIVNGLIFERFLNPGRVSMPDIDLDYPDDLRSLMVAYTKRRYGAEKVAQIITFGTMGARAAIRDVGRAMDMPLTEVDGIARLIPAVPGKPVKIKDVLDSEHEFYSSELEERYKRETAVKTLLETAQSLEGVVRHASSHAAGVIISDKPLVEYVPLNRPTSGEEGLGGVDRVTQWPMEIVESIGLLKVDFLGLSTLTVMRRAARLIEERYGTVYTMDNIPYDQGHVGPDPAKSPDALFDMLGRGQVAGVFQVEGAGMRRLMMEMKPRLFDHIIAAISLYRPGPMENIPEYIRRMHSEIYDKKDIVEYHTPALKPILQETYGILVYQEQIIRIAADLAGYEPGEADMIRKAVSKKKKSLMEEHRLKFTDGAMERGFSREVCDAIWGDIEFFARYGFNKCLPGDVKVLDAQTGQLVKIEDIANGRYDLQQTVTCDTDQLKLKSGQITAVLDNGIKPVYRLTTSLGKQIEATTNHPFFTFNGWRWLGELSIGEQIALPRNLPIQGNQLWPEHEVIALGHLLAEGNLCHPHSVYYYSQSEISLNDYTTAAEKFSNVTCSVGIHKGTYSVYAKRVDIQQEPGIVTWAKALDIWGKRATQKAMPNSVFTLPNTQIALLLGRMWDGDGCIIQQLRQNIHAYYATSSQVLAQQVQHLLLRLGIMSSLRAQTFAYKDGRIGYQVHIMGGEHMVQFAKRLGAHLLQPTHQALCQQIIQQNFMATAVHDTIPVSVKEIIRAEKSASGQTWLEINAQTGVAQREFYPQETPTKKGFRRNTIGRLAAYFDSQDLRKLAESDIYWDEIVAIEYVGEKQTYDLTIDGTHNFIANDILVHNSHAADYAKVTCQTAFLKAHYPVEYLTAMLSVERDNTEKVRRYFAEAKSLGIDVAPPDVTKSGLDFTIEDDGERPLIRFGLGAIKNAGAAALSLIIDEREANGPFRDLLDLCNRVDMRRVGKRALEFLIKGHAFDVWGTPAQFMDAMDRMVNFSGGAHDAAALGQMSLFGSMSNALAVDMDVDLLHAKDKVKAIDHKDLLEWEKEALGVHVSEHPLERPLAMLSPHTTTTIGQLEVADNGKQIKIAGMISHLRVLTTKKGDPMAFGTLEDLDDKIDVVFFPRTWKECRDMVAVDQVMLLWGKVQAKEDNSVNVIVDRVQTKVENGTAREDNQALGLGNGYENSYSQGNGNGRSTPPPPYTPQPAKQEVIKESGSFTPPPPPNFDEESEALPIRREQLIVNSKQATDSSERVTAAPPPATATPEPVTNPSTGSGQVLQSSDAAQAKSPIISDAQPSAPTKPRPVFGDKPNGFAADSVKTMVVEIKPVGNWKETCREVIQMARQYEGEDRLRLEMITHNWSMEFPNYHTKICQDLLVNLRRLPGVASVKSR